MREPISVGRCVFIRRVTGMETGAGFDLGLCDCYCLGDSICSVLLRSFLVA
jgi:hypothetical protein